MRKNKPEVKLLPNGKINGPNLTKMRDIAFGNLSQTETFKVLDKAEKMRDDDSMLDEAEEKRKRKNEKRALFASRYGTKI